MSLFKIQFKMREHIRNVKEEGKYFFVHKVISENTQKKTSHAAHSKLFINILSHALLNI